MSALMKTTAVKGMDLCAKLFVTQPDCTQLVEKRKDSKGGSKRKKTQSRMGQQVLTETLPKL